MGAFLAAVLDWVLNTFFKPRTAPPPPVVTEKKVSNAIHANEVGAAVQRDIASDDGLRDYAARDPHNRDN